MSDTIRRADALRVLGGYYDIQARPAADRIRALPAADPAPLAKAEARLAAAYLEWFDLDEACPIHNQYPSREAWHEAGEAWRVFDELARTELVEARSAYRQARKEADDERS